ncbi:MAG: hypothetical protein PVH39_07260 [Syntrophobacterales bacterium]
MRFTTEAQSTQRMLFFPWPGDDGQGKEHPPAAEALEAGFSRSHETTRLLDRARRAAISSPIAVSRSG